MNDDNYTRITFRMPRDLHAKLQKSADTTSKSMNAEIIARLEASFDDEEGLSDVEKKYLGFLAKELRKTSQLSFFPEENGLVQADLVFQDGDESVTLIEFKEPDVPKAGTIPGETSTQPSKKRIVRKVKKEPE